MKSYLQPPVSVFVGVSFLKGVPCGRFNVLCYESTKFLSELICIGSFVQQDVRLRSEQRHEVVVHPRGICFILCSHFRLEQREAEVTLFGEVAIDSNNSNMMVIVENERLVERVFFTK